jgi:hypothetical protein
MTILGHRSASIRFGTKGVTMAAKKSTSEPFAIPFSRALENDWIAINKGYKLMNSNARRRH